MKRYYFYTPNEYRDECRKKGIIDFNLAALYCEDAFSDKVGQKVKSFSYFDEVKAFVCTRTDGQYSFRIETGKDLASGHYAKSEKELFEAYKASIQISERNYLRLRKVALGLMFRHTQIFNQPDSGENKYLWCNEYRSSFYDLSLAALNYTYNSKNDDDDTLQYFKERGLPLYDCSVSEEIRIHIAKPNKKTKERSFKCSTFEIKGHKANCRYYDLPDAIKSLKKLNEYYEDIERFQFDRIRKICKALMFDYSELEYSELKKPQTHSIRILDL